MEGAYLSFQHSIRPEQWQTVLDDLVERHFAVRQDLFPEELVAALAEEARRLWEAGRFRRARIGRGSHQQLRPEIRSDFIHWLHPEQLSPPQAAYWTAIDQLRLQLNRALFLNLREFEAHLAVYPPGTFYRRHLDQFREGHARLITCLLYLNRDWREDFGGQLRIYLPDNEDAFVDVLPMAGTFVMFRSDTVAHEVLPATRHRFSITGWLRRETGPF